MKMSKVIADQISQLLNTQNELTVHYTAEKVLANQDQYIVRFGEKKIVIGAVEIKKVQWYQCEIDHLSVHPDVKRKGVGTWLIQKAESRVKELNARVAQCTIRVGNEASENLFKKAGFVATVTFLNEQNGNKVTVYQKAL
jgi:N-acetylglutamate synthase-like GNAT family acetyltransferase